MTKEIAPLFFDVWTHTLYQSEFGLLPSLNSRGSQPPRHWDQQAGAYHLC